MTKPGKSMNEHADIYKMSHRGKYASWYFFEIKLSLITNE